MPARGGGCPPAHPAPHWLCHPGGHGSGAGDGNRGRNRSRGRRRSRIRLGWGSRRPDRRRRRLHVCRSSRQTARNAEGKGTRPEHAHRVCRSGQFGHPGLQPAPAKGSDGPRAEDCRPRGTDEGPTGDERGAGSAKARPGSADRLCQQTAGRRPEGASRSAELSCQAEQCVSPARRPDRCARSEPGRDEGAYRSAGFAECAHLRGGRVVRIRSLLIACHVVAVSGCAIAQLQQDSGQMSTRIADKEAKLNQLESERASLAAEREKLTAEQQKLLAEIDTKQMTLNDLDARLERLRQENRQLRSETEQQQKSKERVDADIQKLQAEARRIENDNRLSEAAKQERIEALRKQIKDYLQVMITQ